MKADSIDRYHEILSKDPNSKVFAPLADAYRQMKRYSDAERIAREGVLRHPNFSGGLVTLARILIDQRNLVEAEKLLKKTSQIDPENILAHHLMGSLLLDLKRPKEALKSYKMVLFLNPNSQKAQDAVKKLESLTADEFEEDLFAMSKLKGLEIIEAKKSQTDDSFTVSKPQGLERYLSLIDAFIVRNNLDRALEIIENAELEFPLHPEIVQRKQMFTEDTSIKDEPTPLRPIQSREHRIRDEKLKTLRAALKRVDSARNLHR